MHCKCWTSKGHEQAQRIADYLRNKANRQQIRIITSSYLRAQQTAQPTHLYFSEALFEVWPAVQEFDYLSLPANEFTTPADRSPLVRELWGLGNPSFKHETKAESFNAFISRVQEVLKKLCEFQEEKLVVVFSHYQFIQAVRWLLAGGVKGTNPQPDEMDDFYHFLKKVSVPNGAILKTHLGRVERTVLSCETSHLDQEILPGDISENVSSDAIYSSAQGHFIVCGKL